MSKNIPTGKFWFEILLESLDTSGQDALKALFLNHQSKAE